MTKSYARQLSDYLQRYRLKIAGMVLALLCTSCSVLLLGRGLGYLVDHGFARGNSAILNQILIALLGLITLLAVATYFRSRLIYTISEQVITDIRQDVFAHLLFLSPDYYEQHKTSDIASRLTNDTTLLSGIIANVASVALRNLLMLSGGLFMLIYTSPKLTGLVLLLVPIIIGPIIYYGKKVRALSHKAQEDIALLGGSIEEVLQGIRTVQAYTREDYEIANFNQLAEQSLASSLQRIRTRSSLVGMVILLVFSAIAGVVWVGGQDVLQGKMTPGELSSFIFYAVIVAASAGWITEVVSDIQRASAALERLFSLLALTSDISSPIHPAPLPVGYAGAISFSDISFIYPTRPQNKVIDHFSLDIKAGECIAIVGPSGAGKTTLFQLLLRFYLPGEGEIRLGNVATSALSLQELRRQFGYVAQEPVIFSASARDNILYGNPAASNDALIAAAQTAEAREFIETLPQGLDTFLGERGVRLSGGQRQRIAIARALLKDPKIILLDEATSNLDSENERLVQQGLEKLMRGRTTLIIAHRISTIRNADRIVVLDKGSIVGIGTHKELLASNELYQKLAIERRES